MKNAEKPADHSMSFVGTLTAMLLGAVFGGLIWALSPALVGCEEPWDATWPYYWIAMCLGGFVSGLVSPRYFWIPLFGIYVGQVAFGAVALNLTGPIIFPLFISVAIFGAPLTLVGAGIAFAVVALTRTISRSKP